MSVQSAHFGWALLRFPALNLHLTAGFVSCRSPLKGAVGTSSVNRAIRPPLVDACLSRRGQPHLAEAEMDRTLPA